MQNHSTRYVPFAINLTSVFQAISVWCLLASAAIAQTHPILDAPGFQRNREYSSEAPFDNIDTLSGALVLNFTDLVLPGNAGRDLKFQRTYNSKGGFGWTFGIAGLPLFITEPALPLTPLDHPQDRTPILHMADGGIRKLAWAGVPDYTTPSTLNVTVSRDFWRYDRSTRTLTIPDGRVCEYDENSADPPPTGKLRLATCTDPFGNDVTFSWSAAPDPLEIEITPGARSGLRSPMRGAPGSIRQPVWCHPRFHIRQRCLQYLRVRRESLLADVNQRRGLDDGLSGL